MKRKISVVLCFLILFGFIGTVFGTSGTPSSNDSTDAFYGQPSKLIVKIGQLGGSIVTFFNTPEALYVIYFLAFFFITYIIINTALSRVIIGGSGGSALFSKKPRQVIGAMIAFIVTGSVFYGKSAEDVINAFHGFGGFILGLFFAVVAIGLGIYYFKYYSDESRRNRRLAFLILFVGFYVGTLFLLPQLGTYQATDNSWSTDTNDFLFNLMGGAKGPAQTILESLQFINDVSLWGIIICLILLLVQLFRTGGDDSESSSNDKNTQRHERRTNEYKTVLNVILNDMRGANNHFNNKVNILNDLRSEVGRLRSRDKGGR